MSDIEQQIRGLRDQGMPMKRIAARLDVSYARVWRVVNAEKAERQARLQYRRERERANRPLPPRRLGQTLPWEGITE